MVKSGLVTTIWQYHWAVLAEEVLVVVLTREGLSVVLDEEVLVVVLADGVLVVVLLDGEGDSGHLILPASVVDYDDDQVLL